MTELNKNSYIKILEENTDINKLNIYGRNYATKTNMGIKINNQLQEISNSIGNINSPANIAYDGSNNIGIINNLPLKWILARERLINNAKRLNNGWKVDWNSPYTLQEGRAHLYSSGCNQFNKFVISETYAVWKQSEDGLIFKTRNLARQFINENQEDLQIYFSL